MFGKDFDNLVDIIYRLRKECPWDREQTNDSIKANTIEEAYEVVEAIENKDFEDLKKELGDLLLHVIFHTVIAEEDNHFNLSDVIEAIKSKLIRRHPHVFGELKVDGSKEITKNWEKIKFQEGRKSLLEGIPRSLPGLQRASRIQEKASKVGFDWERKEDVWKKVQEEILEMQESEKNGNLEELENEMGDVFFALINYCRFVGINPENALRKTNDKFIRRFQYIEKKLEDEGKHITESNLEEMDKYWEESKDKV